jgi:hypothetical protein
MFLRGHVVADKSTEGCLTIGGNDTVVTPGQILTNRTGILGSAAHEEGVPLSFYLKGKERDYKGFAGYE